MNKHQFFAVALIFNAILFSGFKTTITGITTLVILIIFMASYLLQDSK